MKTSLVKISEVKLEAVKDFYWVREEVYNYVGSNSAELLCLEYQSSFLGENKTVPFANMGYMLKI